MISAEVVADSTNGFGQRITTLVVVMPRIVLAEFNTHRMFSRNSASSRAIPFKKMVRMVQENPFIPLKFQRDHSGMQGTEYLDEAEHEEAVLDWLFARDSALLQAKELNQELGVTKQLANRLLEPFMYHKVLVTATEWDNFFTLRDHPDAEIHICQVAKEIKKAMENSVPKLLMPGEWHIPFGDNIDGAELLHLQRSGLYGDSLQDLRIKIAIARCARLSYQTLGDNPKIDYAADLRLFDQLLAGGHMSPFEHVAKRMNDKDLLYWSVNVPFNKEVHGHLDTILGDVSGLERVIYSHPDPEVGLPLYVTSAGWCGNFRGFIQYRKLIPGESGIKNIQ